MNGPLVSICIPTHNGERFISATLRSVLNQTYRNLEIIISDDSSTDQTLDIVSSVRDERIVVRTTKTPMGAARNWNLSCAPASGIFIKLLCQDDILLPTCVERQVQTLTVHEDCTFCWSPRDVISPRGHRLLKSRRIFPNDAELEFEEAAALVVRSGTNMFGEPCAVLMRSSAYRKTSGFEGEYLIDLAMWFNLLEHGPAVYRDEFLSQFRIAPSTWTSVLRRQHAAQFREFIQDIAQRCPSVTADDCRIGATRALRLQRLRALLVSALRIIPL